MRTRESIVVFKLCQVSETCGHTLDSGGGWVCRELHFRRGHFLDIFILDLDATDDPLHGHQEPTPVIRGPAVSQRTQSVGTRDGVKQGPACPYFPAWGAVCSNS